MTIYTLMPLHQCLGLAVIGVDLNAPIDAETSENLSRLLAEHLVLVFPDQPAVSHQPSPCREQPAVPINCHSIRGNCRK